MKTAIFAAITALCFLLAAALGRWPYAFYILLRLFVSVTAVYLAYTSAQGGKTAWAWIMGAIALAYNPILPLRMHRADWQVVNVVTCVPFAIFSAFEFRRLCRIHRDEKAARPRGRIREATLTNEDPIVISEERIPDFAWPYQIAELLSEWLSAQWKTLVEQYTEGFFRRRIPRVALQTAFWSCIVYIGLLWVCLCYIYYPVSPYGVWDLMKWVAIVAAVTLSAAYTVCGGVYGGIAIALLLGLLLTLTVYSALSLPYLCWELWSALRKGSPWLKRYRSAMFIGVAACLLVATFVDGSYRFWDRSFEVKHWATLVFVAASAWAALFCHLVRDEVMEGGKPRSVLKWTVGFAMGITLVAYWGANGRAAEYFLRKKVMQAPKDPNAWLELGWHYSDEGDKLAADPGDDDHPAPDPTPSYSEALECLNQAVSLGAGGFEVQASRAQLADAIGEKQDAVSFGRQALNLAPSPSDSSSEEDVKWLREMISRNAAAPSESQRKSDRIQQVRDERRERVPGILRFWFEAHRAKP